MQIKKHIVVIIFTLNACAQNTADKSYNESFLTHINQSGLKHFELRYTHSHSPRSTQSQKNLYSGEALQRDAESYQRRRKYLDVRLRELLTSNGFCREGFLPLDFNSDWDSYYLRGECYDLATDADRQNFPDTITQW